MGWPVWLLVSCAEFLRIRARAPEDARRRSENQKLALDNARARKAG